MTTPDHPETFNGWTNRETWAMALHMDNDHGLYLMIGDIVSEAIQNEFDQEHVSGNWRTYIAAHALEDWFTNWVDDEAGWETVDHTVEISAGLWMILHEVGSVWRVDWSQIAEGWVDLYFESHHVDDHEIAAHRKAEHERRAYIAAAKLRAAGQKWNGDVGTLQAGS